MDFSFLVTFVANYYKQYSYLANITCKQTSEEVKKMSSLSPNVFYLTLPHTHLPICHS